MSESSLAFATASRLIASSPHALLEVEVGLGHSQDRVVVDRVDAGVGGVQHAPCCDWSVDCVRESKDRARAVKGHETRSRRGRGITGRSGCRQAADKERASIHVLDGSVHGLDLAVGAIPGRAQEEAGQPLCPRVLEVGERLIHLPPGDRNVDIAHSDEAKGVRQVDWLDRSPRDEGRVQNLRHCGIERTRSGRLGSVRNRGCVGEGVQSKARRSRLLNPQRHRPTCAARADCERIADERGSVAEALALNGRGGGIALEFEGAAQPICAHAEPAIMSSSAIANPVRARLVNRSLLVLPLLRAAIAHRFAASKRPPGPLFRHKTTTFCASVSIKSCSPSTTPVA